MCKHHPNLRIIKYINSASFWLDLFKNRLGQLKEGEIVIYLGNKVHNGEDWARVFSRLGIGYVFNNYVSNEL